MNALTPISPTRFALTDRQRDCFNAIERHIAICRHSPTTRELAKAMGFKTPSRVLVLLEALQERGWIKRLPNKARTIVVVPDPAATGYALPAEIDARLRAHCAATGEDPADVLADAVTLFFDEAEGSVAA